MEDRNSPGQIHLEGLLEDLGRSRIVDTVRLPLEAGPDWIRTLIDGLRRLIFPGPGPEQDREQYLQNLVSQAAQCLHSRLRWACEAAGQAHRNTVAMTDAFLSGIPQIRALVQTDLEAAFRGDPAATGPEELVLCYPGVYAVTVYRLAHRLYTLNVPLLPRIMTEYAHSVTGIDIHPGAQIGSHFFIDHGTGTVIGQTAHIGNHVQLYQGVTLGALSPRGGAQQQGAQRHPTVEDGVTIYAGATVLGGTTVIGCGAVIGANAFITACVPPGMTVTGRYPIKKEHPPA